MIMRLCCHDHAPHACQRQATAGKATHASWGYTTRPLPGMAWQCSNKRAFSARVRTRSSAVTAWQRPLCNEPHGAACRVAQRSSNRHRAQHCPWQALPPAALVQNWAPPLVSPSLHMRSPCSLHRSADAQCALHSLMMPPMATISGVYSTLPSTSSSIQQQSLHAKHTGSSAQSHALLCCSNRAQHAPSHHQLKQLRSTAQAPSTALCSSRTPRHLLQGPHSHHPHQQLTLSSGASPPG